MSDTFLLDLKGFNCPIPAIRTKKKLRQLTAGDRLEVICTDPLSQIDIPFVIQQTGHRLISVSVADSDIFTFIIELCGHDAASESWPFVE